MKKGLIFKNVIALIVSAILIFQTVSIVIPFVVSAIKSDSFVYENDFSSNVNGWENYWLEDANQSFNMSPCAFGMSWVLYPGVIARTNQDFDSNGNRITDTLSATYNIAQLTYTERKYKDFMLEVKYNFSGSTNTKVMIGFGRKDVTKYAGHEDGGTVLVFGNNADFYGIGSFKDGIKTTDIVMAPASAVQGKSVNVKIISLGGKASIYINDEKMIVYELPENQEGYISIGASKAGGMTFDNVKITEMANIAEGDVLQAVSVESVADVEWERTFDSNEKPNLPSKLKVTVSDGSVVDYEVEWVPETGVNIDRTGRCKYIGTLIPPFGGLYGNKSNITAEVDVDIKVDFSNINNVYENDFTENINGWENYWLADATQSTELATCHYSRSWAVYPGCIVRTNQGHDSNGNAVADILSENHNIAQLTYMDRVYKDFKLETSYVFGGSASTKVIIAFGRKDPTKYAGHKDGGTAIVLGSNGEFYLTGMFKNGISTSSTVMAPSSAAMGNEVNLKVIVNNGVAVVYINDVKLAAYDMPDDNEGYIAIGASKAAGTTFNNVKITYELELPEEQMLNAVSIDKVEDISWARTEDNNNTLKMPETICVEVSDGTKVDYDVVWAPAEKYNLSKPGRYKYIGTLLAPFGGEYGNSQNLTAEAYVDLTVDYNPETTIKYYIDSIGDFDEDFKNYYAEDALVDDLEKKNVADVYTIVDGGVLMRKDVFEGNLNYCWEIESLVYEGFEFNNFQLDVDFRQGGNGWGYAMMTFGIQEPTTFVSTKSGGYMVYLELEGRTWVRGVLSDGATYINTGNSLHPTYNDSWYTEMHHMTLTVINKFLTVYIDGIETIQVQLGDHYIGGLISMMSMKNCARYDNLSITALDYEGNVITLEESKNLPLTYDGEAPLIGVEPDNGKPPVISGVAYTKGNLKENTSSKPVSVYKGGIPMIIDWENKLLYLPWENITVGGVLGSLKYDKNVEVTFSVPNSDEPIENADTLLVNGVLMKVYVDEVLYDILRVYTGKYEVGKVPNVEGESPITGQDINLIIPFVIAIIAWIFSAVLFIKLNQRKLFKKAR